MTINLTTSEIKQKSVTGAKWLFITNALNVPGAFLMAFFLGRTSPEALGAFGLVQVFIGVISTFVVFGGQAVLRNFMAKVMDPVLRGKLFFTYTLILLGLLGAMTLIFAFIPGLLEFFLRREVTKGVFLFFILFSFVVISSQLFASAIAGMMNIKISTIAQTVTRLLPLPGVAFFFFWNRPFLAEYAWFLILGFYLISFSIGSLISAAALLRDQRFKLSIGTYTPKGFMPFCLTTHLATIFTFMYNDVDRIFMLQLGEMGGLGMYQAVISIARFIDYVPVMLSAALVPMFSSLLASKNQHALTRSYDMIQRYSVIIITIFGIFTISFSRELLNVFGSEYVENYYILAMFGLSGIVCSLGLGNATILTSYEKNAFRLSVSIIQILIQIVGTFLLIGSYGVLAVAGFKSLGRIVANMLCFSKT